MITVAPILAGISTDGLSNTDGKYLRYPIGDSVPDAHTIIAYLQQFSEEFGRNPDIRLLAALALPRNIADNDIPRQIESLASFVMRNVKYVRDPDGVEYVINPLYLLRQLREPEFSQLTGPTIGDCDDHVLFLNSMLRSLGIETLAVGVKLYARDRFDHVISSAWDGDQWVDVDLCAKGTIHPIYSERLVPR